MVYEETKREAEVATPKSFILGGKSEFTIENLRSGNSFKYRVTKARDNDEMYFVRVKEGGESWSYAGFLSVNKVSGFPYYIQGRKGTLDIFSAPIKGILYALRYTDKPLPEPMLLRHHGKCACCGKSLNDPESVQRGFGPVCWATLNKKAV